MHLGRFHATIVDLNVYYKGTGILAGLDQCAAQLEQYMSNPTANSLTLFRQKFDEVLKKAELNDPDLLQPYAQEIIRELGLQAYIGKSLVRKLKKIVADGSFDHQGIARSFRELKKNLSSKTDHIVQIEEAFTDFGVEYERVWDGESEVGVLLPRKVVGETVTSVVKEFRTLGNLFRALNELTGAEEYDPKIRTISSSWWQLFVELDVTQIAALVVAIERIVSLFKTNVEIKNLQKQLSDKNIPEEIVQAIEKVISARVNDGITKLASELRERFGKGDDQNRLNELEIQLRRGLAHLAKRISEGAQVEVNVALPEKPEKKDGKDGEPVNDAEFQQALESYKEQMAILRDLRNRGRLVSQQTLKIDANIPLMLEAMPDDADADGEDDDDIETPA